MDKKPTDKKENRFMKLLSSRDKDSLVEMFHEAHSDISDYETKMETQKNLLSAVIETAKKRNITLPEKYTYVRRRNRTSFIFSLDNL